MDFDLHPSAVGSGLISRIRMSHISNIQKTAYVRYQPDISTVTPITPDAKSKKVTTPVIDGLAVTTPQGKTQLAPDEIIGSLFTPKGQTEHKIFRFSDKAKNLVSGVLDLDKVDFVEMDRLKKQFKLELDLRFESKQEVSQFRGGAVLLTADDVKYRASKHKKTGGHRSLYPQPKHVMGRQSAQEYVTEIFSDISKKFPKWEWGHLFPAGGTPQGVEANVNPYNFVAIPASLNTWQMVPEMIARHLAQLGFKIEYTAIARTESILPSKSSQSSKLEKDSFLAKEIYCSVKLLGHGLKAEFFTTRDHHVKPMITDAVHILKEFYKVANKPIPVDLEEKITTELIAMAKKLPPEAFVSPIHITRPKQYDLPEPIPLLLLSKTRSQKREGLLLESPETKTRRSPRLSMNA